MRIRTLLPALILCLVPARAAIVTYVLQNQSSSIERDVPVTFGAVFANGDVPAGSSITATDAEGHPIPLQVDAKAHNKDGSLRHAVVTVDMPRLAEGDDVRVAIDRGAPTQGPPVSLADLPAGFDAVLDLDMGGSHLTASAHDLLARAKPETWLSGPLVGEWWVAGPLVDAGGKPDPHLSARFGIRSYGKGRPLRIEVDIENTWTWVPDPKTEAYDAAIRIGGRTVFSQDHIVQQAHTRWREVFWWSTPVDVFVKQNLAYLKKTRIIPNYNPEARVNDIGDLMRTFEEHDRTPMSPGVISPYMPATGGRPDIGPLPAWTVDYLLTMDKDAAKLTMVSGDRGGAFASHYRNEKTGRPTTTEEFPDISTHYNYVGRPNNLPLPDMGTFYKGLAPEASHEPSLAFIPYAVTGERYYLEELEFWSQWNSWGTAPDYHGHARSLFGWDEIRGQGWSLRTLAQAAYIVPDNDPIKPTLLRELRANAEWYDTTFTNNPRANIFHAALRASGNSGAVAPWMDDFLTWAAGYAVGLGFDEWRPFARWKATFPVQRMINPDFCYVMATKYYVNLMDAPHHFLDSWAAAYVWNIPKKFRTPDVASRITCGSDEMAEALKIRTAGQMFADNPNGYTAQMQPALAAAVDLGVPGAEEAWAKFMSRPAKPRAPIKAQWDILPWNAK